jgi:hypothetical protein
MSEGGFAREGYMVRVMVRVRVRAIWLGLGLGLGLYGAGYLERRQERAAGARRIRIQPM